MMGFPPGMVSRKMSEAYDPGGLAHSGLAVSQLILGAGESPEAVEGLASCHRVSDA
jgi:hypothetical protein